MAGVPAPVGPARSVSSGRPDASVLRRTQIPGIYSRGEKFVVVWRHRGRQHKQTYATFGEAVAARRRRRSGDTRPDRRPNGRDSFARYARQWVEEYRGRTYHGLDESTRRDYARSLEVHAIPVIGDMALRDIIPWDIRQVAMIMERKGLRPGTVRKHIAPVKALFATAYEDALIDRNPALPIRIGGRRPDMPDELAPYRALTHEQLERLLAVLDPETRLLVEFFVHTGMRFAEVAGLTWECVHFDLPPRVDVRQQYRDGRVKLPKTPHSRRTIPLAPGMAAALAERKAQSNDPVRGWVFPSKTGRPLDAHNVSTRKIRPAARAAGLEQLGFHQLRHTCASLLLESGKDIKQVQEWLGHHDSHVTMGMYLHLLDRGLGDAEFMDLVTGQPMFGRSQQAITGTHRGGPPRQPVRR